MPVTVDQYGRLTEEGIIPENTELIRGVILKKVGKSPLHTWIVQSLVERLKAMLPDGVHVRQEQPLTLRDSEPEPDLAVVSGEAFDYRRAHPRTAELVVEVAVSTEELDLEKAGIYSEAGISEYWVIAPKQNAVTIWSAPAEEGYQRRATIGIGDTLVSRRFPEIEIPVSSLFE